MPVEPDEVGAHQRIALEPPVGQLGNESGYIRFLYITIRSGFLCKHLHKV